MRAAIYSRVSTQKQDAENQAAQLKSLAQARGWQLVLEFTDVVSGGSKACEREQLTAAFAAAKAGQFDVLMFWSLDRLTREGTLETLQYLKELKASGVDYFSHEEQYLDSTRPFNDSIISLRADMAREEKRAVSRRTKAGLENLKAQGVKLGRPAKAHDASQLAQVASLRTAGQSLRQIARALGCSKTQVANLLEVAA
jgi:DNA invertase Pin-like site-specific DNA recombinase